MAEYSAVKGDLCPFKDIKLSAKEEHKSILKEENVINDVLAPSTLTLRGVWIRSNRGMMRVSRYYVLYVIGIFVAIQIFLFYGKNEISYRHTRIVHVTASDQSASISTNNTVISHNDENSFNHSGVDTSWNIKKLSIDIANISCERLFDGDQSEIARAKTVMSHIDRSYSLDQVIDITSDCKKYQKQSGYIMDSLTEKEANFPIAYSIVMYKFVPQFEHLFRAIYRPQNLYCIHVDAKALKEVYAAVKAIIGCFPNAFIIPERVDVKWGQISVLTPEILCMDALYNKSKKWKYIINLTGQEFPLKTNSEIVDILTALNGANDVYGVYLSKWKNRYENASQIPHGLRPFKGKVHIVANRDFVDFLLHDQRSRDLLAWVAETKIPDETYFPTLNFNPSLKIPGSYKHELPVDSWTDNGRMSRFKLWKWGCIPGTRVLRHICILGVDYLPLLKNAFPIFANKFLWDYDRVSLRCLDDLLNKRTIDAMEGRYTLNVTEYANMDFVRNKIER